MVEFSEFKEATRIVWQQYPTNLNTPDYSQVSLKSSENKKKFKNSARLIS